MVIDPDVCIDCNVCATECPVGAIYQDKDLPKDQMIFLSINRELASIYPVVTSKSGSLPEADKWKGVEEKRNLLTLTDVGLSLPA
jgi:ferredoxin